MKHDIKVPSMGESISEATVGNIIKATGSEVAMDDEILELETDKVNQVLYAPQDGIITLNVRPEQVVKIGEIIGFVEGKKESREIKFEAKKEEKRPVQTSTSESSEPISTSHPKPVAAVDDQKNKMQQKDEGGADIGARLTKEAWLQELNTGQKSQTYSAEVANRSDVKTLATPTKSDSGSKQETRTKLSKIRRLIASRLVEVQRNTAMLTTFNEVDMTAIMELREKYKDSFIKTHHVKLGFMSFFVKAAASALIEYPEINSYIDGDEIVHREYIDIGIAVGTEKGLIVPVVRNCNNLSFAQIEQSIEAYAKKAREGGLSVDDLQGGGFTITNGGVYGSLLSTPIINPPQCAILGMHKIMKRAVVVNDQIVIRQMMYLALSYDHRLVDGKGAVSFLVHIKNYLEDPSRLLLGV